MAQQSQEEITKLFALQFNRVRETLHDGEPRDTDFRDLWNRILYTLFPLSSHFLSRLQRIFSHHGESIRYTLSRDERGCLRHLAIVDIKPVGAPFEESSEKLKAYMKDLVGTKDNNPAGDKWSNAIWGVQTVGSWWRVYRVEKEPGIEVGTPDLIMDWKENFTSPKSLTSMLSMRDQILTWVHNGELINDNI
ncbi:hypothetical protein JAAARDRAFT_37266 [Jaapia argillacea MUCL 33604]|uniref:Fungal-type protein kinase domain-containing protein n=1 Tax=Jaapia argillacea MUCL 33604 TaxID=933084 RepID=A0A067PLQ7_9AGAM|nr:hypothetical protein JAAARDRAFT_37266 [Jaapia argillacea MUCL 33604]